jgi:hypothetical protein
MPCEQNSGQGHNITLIAEKSFENEQDTICLGRSITNKNYIEEEIACRLIFWNFSNHSISV